MIHALRRIGIAFALFAALVSTAAHAVTATVTNLGGQPVGVSTLKLDNVVIAPAGDGNYALPAGTHEVVVTTGSGATFRSEVNIPGGDGSGRLTLEPGFGGIGKISYAPGPAPGAPPAAGMNPREAMPTTGMAPREADAWTLTVQGSHEEWTLPRVASGVFVVGSGLDRPFKLSPKQVDGEGGGLRLTQPGFWPGVELRYEASYFSGDADNSAQVAPGTNAVGWLYHDRAANGSTGLGLGTSGMDVRTAVDFTRYKFGVGLWDADFGDRRGLVGNLDVRDSFGDCFDRFGGPRLSGGVGAFWQRFETDQRSWLMSPSFGNSITSHFKQDLTEDQFGFGGQLKLSLPLSERASMFAQAGGALIYRRADLDGKQWNRCDLCGAPEDVFVADVDDQDNRLTWAATAGLGLELKLTADLSLGILGSYVYYGDTAQIENPVQGDAARYRPTRLGDHHARGWQLGLGVNYQF